MIRKMGGAGVTCPVIRGRVGDEAKFAAELVVAQFLGESLAGPGRRLEPNPDQVGILFASKPSR
jgi:hypothetical protein